MAVKSPKHPSRVNPAGVAPLSKGFFIASILGLMISFMFLHTISLPWAVAVGVVSFVMFISAMVSITRAPVEEELALDDYDSGRHDRVVVLSGSEYRALQRKKNKTNK